MTVYVRHFLQSTPSNPHLGHAVERLTSVMFDCYRESQIQVFQGAAMCLDWPLAWP